MGPRPSCPSGSVRGPARRLVTQSLLKVKRMMGVQLLPLRNSKKKKRKKRRRRKKRKRRKRKKNKHSVIDHQDFQMAQILEEIRQQVFKITATQPTKLTSIFAYISKI